MASNNQKNLLIISVVAFFICSVFSVGYHHFDEHFQILEFAGLKLGLTSEAYLPWEYQEQMRPSLQPSIAVVIHRIFTFFGTGNPFIITFFFRLISAALSLLATWSIYQLYKLKYKNSILLNWFAIFSFSLWIIIYNGVRFSSENWSGIFFILAFTSYYSFKKNTIKLIFTGILLGLSFLFRYQAGFLIAGMMLWILFFSKEKLKELSLISLGLLTILGLGILVDRWYYGEWTISAWNYFEQNIIENKVSDFGVDPWWYYLDKIFIKGIPPLSILMIASTILYMLYKPKSLITWSILPFIAVHFLIGHKELRFLFPIVYFAPIIIIEAINIVINRFDKNLLSRKYFRITIKIVFIANILALVIIMFKPADSQISLYKKIYNGYEDTTNLYYIDNNPYHRVLDINYYKRPNLNIIKVESIDDIVLGKTSTNLIVINSKEEINEQSKRKLISNSKLIYSSFPEWVTKFNYNNWMDRTKLWYVYELE